MTPTNLTECLAWLDEVKSKNGCPASEEYVRRDMGRATPRFAEFVASRVAECLRGHLQGEAIFGTNIPAPDPSPPKNCMAIGCTASSKPWGEGEAIKAPAPALKMGFDMEVLAEAVHEAYLTTCARLGWHVKEANRVPYSELSEDSKELDRASVRAVLASLPAPAQAEGEPLPNQIPGVMVKGEYMFGYKSPAPVPEVSPAPTWTREKPKVEGWYCWRPVGGGGLAVAEVRMFTGAPCWHSNERNAWVAVWPGLEWAGPIIPKDGDLEDGA